MRSEEMERAGKRSDDDGRMEERGFEFKVIFEVEFKVDFEQVDE